MRGERSVVWREKKGGKKLHGRVQMRTHDHQPWVHVFSMWAAGPGCRVLCWSAWSIGSLLTHCKILYNFWHLGLEKQKSKIVSKYDYYLHGNSDLIFQVGFPNHASEDLADLQSGQVNYRTAILLSWNYGYTGLVKHLQHLEPGL